MPAALQYVQDGDWNRVRLNTDTTAILLNPPVPQARVYNNANISLATSGTLQALTFNSERFDNGDLHSTSANTSRLTVPVTGLYTVGGHVSIAANATGNRQLAVRLNGGTFIAAHLQPNAGAGDPAQLSIVTTYQFVAGDYCELMAMQSSGGALNAVAGGNFSPEFWMVRLAGFVNQGV